MEKPALGKTGAAVTILGLGGFHMLEISKRGVSQIANRDLDAGSSYVDFAAGHGDGHLLSGSADQL